MPAEQSASPGAPPDVLAAVSFGSRNVGSLHTFLTSLPPEVRAAFLLLPSAEDRWTADSLATALGRPVVVPGDGCSIESNIYLISNPERFELRALKLVPRSHPTGNSGDGGEAFVRSLADNAGSRAVAIVLQPPSECGPYLLRAVNERGGMTMMAAPPDGDAQPAVPAELIDHVLPPQELAREFAEHAGFARSHEAQVEDDVLRDVAEHMSAICSTLEEVTGHSFKHYRASTLTRRIHRRMQVRRVASVGEYEQRLRRDPTEVRALFRELLIGVTAFFRDAEAFSVLSRRVIRDLMTKAGPEHGVRIWVPGCATGEEAYTLAMLCREHMTSPTIPKVQIFATDIDEEALQIARSGVYPASIAQEISAERLKECFVRKRKQYRISAELRKMCLFSLHNVISDPPFSRIDLISCRNLLIYFGSHLQKKLLSLFHYAIRPGGYLFLGPSESMTAHTDSFRVVDAKHRIFQRKTSNSPPPGVHGAPLGAWPQLQPARGGAAEPPDIGGTAQRIMLDEFAPAYAVVNEQMQVVYLSTKVERYLRPAPGAFENNVIKMAKPGLGIALRAALADAIRCQHQVVHDRASVRANGSSRPARITVRPMPAVGEENGLLIVVFEDRPKPTERTGPRTRADKVSEAVIQQLETEIASTREDLEKTVQELESSNQEIKSSNEELRSMNEELQSANEELETSKEEIQSALDALARAHSDLENLLASTRIATVFLDEQHQIQRFTPVAAEIYNLIAGDVGRPISDITHNADSMPAIPTLGEVASRPRPVEDEIRMRGGKRFLRRVLAYRNRDNQPTGLVVTFIDSTELRVSEEQARHRLAEIQTVYNAAPIGLCVLDRDLRFARINDRFAEISGTPGAQHLGRTLAEMMPDVSEQLGGKLRKLIRAGTPMEDSEIEVESPADSGTKRAWLISGYALRSENRITGANLVAVEITARRRAERRLAAEHAISTILAEGTTFEAALPRVLAALCEKMEADLAEYWVSSGPDKDLRLVGDHVATAALSDFAERGRGLRLEAGSGLPGRVLKSKRPAWLTDYAAGDPTARADIAARLGIQTGICFPILRDREVAGVVCLHMRARMTSDSATLDSFAAIGRALGQFMQRTEAERGLRRHTQTLASLNRVNSTLAAELDLERVVQSVTDAGTELTGAQFGAFFYNVEDDERGKYMLYTIAGVPRSAFETFPMPRATQLFGPTFRGEGIVRIADVLEDERYGKSAPYHGMPAGHLPVRSYLAVPVISRNGTVEGGLFFGHSEVGVFTEEHEFLLSGIAAQAAIAIENARLYAERSRLAAIVETTHDAIIGETLDGQITSWNPGAERLFGYTAAEILGEHVSILAPEDLRHETADFLATARAGHVVIDADTVRRTKDGRLLDVLLTVSPLRNAGGEVVGASIIVRDITERKRAQKAIVERVRQQRALAELGVRTVQEANLQRIFDDAVSTVARTLDVEFCKVLELLPGGLEVFLRSGVGWNEGLVGLATVSTGLDSQAGYTLMSEAPVVVDDLRSETRFSGPSLLIEHGVISGMSYVLRGEGGKTWGVLGTHTRQRRHFTEDDVAFLVGVSNVISGAIQRASTEAALRESEGRFRTLADAIPQMAWAARADGFIYWYNQRWYEYTGATPEQMEGWGWQSVHDPAVLPEVLATWKHSLSTGEPFNMVFPLRGADGTFRPFLTLVKPLRDDAGNILQWFGTNTDITQQRAMEDALRESEARFRKLADTAPVLIWTADTDNHSTWFNQPWLKFTGRPLDDEVGDGWAAGIHSDDRERAIATSRRAFELRQPFQMEFRLRRADGEYRDMLDTGIPQYSGEQFLGYVGSCIDVTELRRAQADQAQLAAIVEDSDDAIISKDLDGVIQTWNAGAEHIFGFTAEEIIGRHITTIIPPDRLEEERHIIERLRRGERVEHFDTIRVRKDGELVAVSEVISPIRDASGRVIGASKVSRDITERRRNEESLREYAGRLTAILDTAVDGIITIDEKGTVGSANPAAIRMFGYDRDELLGQNVKMLMPEPFHGEHDGYLDNYLRTGERRIIGIGREVVGRRKDGSTFPMELAVSETILEGGARLFTGLVRDITERKRSVAALQEYAGRLAAIFNTAVDAIITINERGVIESSNPAVARVFGYRPEEIAGQNIKLLMPQPYRGEHDGYIDNYLRTGDPKIIGIGREVTGQRKDGSLFPMELAVSETRVGDGRIFTGIVRDISARKQSEETLRESEERLRLAVGNAPLILLHCDAERRFTWFAGNVTTDGESHATRYSSVDPPPGFRVETILGRTAEELIGEQAAPFVEMQQRVLETGHGLRGEVTVESPLGRRTWDAAIEAVREPSSYRVVGLTVAALDITERKLAEERQQLLLAELSHRVKNTLATVQSIATQTVLHCPTPAQFRESFEARLHSLAHTHSLLTRGQWRGADLRAIVAGELSPHVAGDSGKVRVEGPRLYLSPKAALSLHLVFHELATNAAKYGALSAAGGQVEVTWSLADVNEVAHLRVHWIESGGPKVSPPGRRGFGSVVIENSVQYELDGTANVEYREGGLHCEFLIPWSEAVGFVQVGT